MKPTLIPVLALCAQAALAGLATGAWAAPAPASTPAPLAATQIVYAGGLLSGWQNWSWAATATSRTPALSAGSMQVQAQGWQALYLHHAALRTSPSSSLIFWINGGPSGGQSLVVRALRTGTSQVPVTLPPLRANLWQQVQIPAAKLGVGSVSDLDGVWIQNNTPGALKPFYVDQVMLTQVGAAPAVSPPAAPGGLTATPKWNPDCPKCGIPMAHIILAWNAVPGAASYTVYRSGIKLVSQATPGCTDMAVTSGQSYSYTVSATGTGGEGAQSAAVSAVAPSPPASAATLTAPVNLCVQGVWTGVPTDALSWSPVPGAASYNVYQYGTQIGSGLKTPNFAVPPGIYADGMTYTVTAVDSMGMESLPSAVTQAQGMANPAQQPGWMPGLPAAPQSLVAAAEWNAGGPRIHLQWKGDGSDSVYNVYRDGAPVALGLWGLSYYDTAAKPGETHSYTVTGVCTPWTQAVESLPCAAVSATALGSAPAARAGAAVQVTGVQANDDGAVISFAAVPGAVDYRVFDAANPNSVKYSGGGLSIEMNGIDPVAGGNLVVQAVDKLGPFQTMDGMAGPGAMQMDGMHEAVNGQGDPSNIPQVLAQSAPVAVTCTPRTLTGSQVFFDTFRGEQPLTLQPLPAAVQGEFYGVAGQYAEYANDKWAMRNYGGDIADSKVFFMGSHFMDTLYDGGTPRTSDPMHNNNGSLVMMPKATADISGGRVMHVTFEVDAHFSMRRWCELEIGAAGDTLINPGKIVTGSGPNLPPTAAGNILRWRIDGQFHQLSLFENAGTPAAPNIEETDMFRFDYNPGNDRGGPAARVDWTGAPLSNGTMQDLDKRHRFDLYLSQTHYRLMESGQVIKDADFPAGATLPFDQCQAYFVHQVYHTSNDRGEQVTYFQPNSYWPNYRPFCDERHWDNCGEEVLSGFPALP